MERSIQELAKLAGTTSRTLRHYDEIGLLKPSSIGANGYRYYDDRSLVRPQRILLLNRSADECTDILNPTPREPTSHSRVQCAHLVVQRLASARRLINK